MKRVSILLSSIAIIAGCGGGGSNNNASDNLYEITSSNYDRATSISMVATDDLPISPEIFQTVTEEGCVEGNYTQEDVGSGVDYKFNNCVTTSDYVLNGEVIYNNSNISFGKNGFKVLRSNESYNFISGSLQFNNDTTDTDIIKIDNLEYEISIKNNLHYIKVKDFNFDTSNQQTFAYRYLTSSDIIDNKWIDIKGKYVENNYDTLNIAGANNSSIKIETVENNSYDSYKITLNSKEILTDKSDSEKEKAIDKRDIYFNYK